MSGSFTITWDVAVLIPLFVVLLWLVAAVVLRDHVPRIIVTLVALVIGALFTWIEGPIQGPGLWATLVAWLFANLLLTGLVVAVAIIAGFLVHHRGR